MGCELRLLGIGITLSAHRAPARRTTKVQTTHEVTINGRGKTETVAAGEDGTGWYEPGGRAFPAKCNLCVEPFF